MLCLINLGIFKLSNYFGMDTNSFRSRKDDEDPHDKSGQYKKILIDKIKILRNKKLTEQ